MAALSYFAYGSNMLLERLLARQVVLLDKGQPARAEGYKLLFNKKSDDGSAKANLVAESGAECWGILYSVDANSLNELNRAEGAPEHYCSQKNFSVKVADAGHKAMTYISQSDKILTVPDRPYDWYLALILAGAKACAGIPSSWITQLHQVGQSKPDTMLPARTTFNEAVAQLKAAGYDNWRVLLNL